MIRIAICDDEKKILDEVTGYVRITPKRKTTRIFRSFASSRQER